MNISVLTIVRDRPAHLACLVEGLRRSVVQPVELIIVDMGSTPPATSFDTAFPIHLIRFEGHALPLAAARNAAAGAAKGEYLLFLDVDCIPMANLVAEMHRHLSDRDALFCAEIFYLGPGDACGKWNEAALKRSASRHPLRAFPPAGIRQERNAGLFWSLLFAVRRARFLELRGFDEAFTGYGAEDTDFGFRAHRAGVPMMFVGGSGAFHQYHDVLDPPLQHLDDIVRNAQVFFDRWRFWPMEGWLSAFSAMGVIDWSDSRIALLRLPSPSEMARALQKGTI